MYKSVHTCVYFYVCAHVCAYMYTHAYKLYLNYYSWFLTFTSMAIIDTHKKTNPKLNAWLSQHKVHRTEGMELSYN